MIVGRGRSSIRLSSKVVRWRRGLWLEGVEVAKRKWTPSPMREARYESERRAIIRAAYRLIGHETGFVSVQDILEEAGLSTGVLSPLREQGRTHPLYVPS